MKIANGHQPVIPYLILNSVEKFITITQVVFGAEEIYKGYSNGNEGHIMHAEVRINGCNIMLADVTAAFGVANANLFVYVTDADYTYNLALQHGANIIAEMADQSYGRSGGVQDPFGNVWWITSMT